MPSLNRHLEFDDARLRKNGVIGKGTDGTAVHQRMDRRASDYDKDHLVLDEWHTPKGIRVMVSNLVASLGTVRPETATDFVRIAYGHVVLDRTVSRVVQEQGGECSDLDWGRVYTLAYRQFRRSKYHSKRYKPRGR